MIPARLTGKPFWDLYLYQDPPIWKAYIDCVKHFGFDSLMDGYAPIIFPDEVNQNEPAWESAIIHKDNTKIIVRKYYKENRKLIWAANVTVFHRDNPPTRNVKPEKIGLPEIPKRWQPVEGVKEWPSGGELLKYVKELMGDHGLVGVWCGTSILLHTPEAIYDYFDNPSKYRKRSEELLEWYENRFHRLMSLPVKPDFLCVGGSGSLVFQTPHIFRELALPIIQRITALAKNAGIPTHLHSCGPEKELVRICAEETDLTVIDPLEVPPMGDCNLRELKVKYGDKLVLKGNLHTTTVMLKGSIADVVAASRKAIDDAAEGGRFILSTGDQCGRDTPDDNIRVMIETARTYGKY